MTGGKPPDRLRSMVCGNANMRTHAQVKLQFGAYIPATAKPEKKNKDISGMAKSGILSWVR